MLGPAGCDAQSDIDLAALGRESNRVVEQIRDEAVQAVHITQHLAGVGAGQSKVQTLRLRYRQVRGDR